MCTKGFYIFHKLLKIRVKLQTFIWQKKNKNKNSNSRKAAKGLITKHSHSARPAILSNMLVSNVKQIFTWKTSTWLLGFRERDSLQSEWFLSCPRATVTHGLPHSLSKAAAQPGEAPLSDLVQSGRTSPSGKARPPCSVVPPTFTQLHKETWPISKQLGDRIN